MTEAQTDKTTILVVDDMPANLHLLVSLLKEHQYHVWPAPSGHRALQKLEKSLPDLILLDINMPEMDGYEVCRRLKSAQRTRDIPVIFISAADETLNKVKAFSVGGLDYITKPFQVEEVFARIQTHLTLRALQKRLQQRNQQLQQEIVERKRAEAELVLAEKMAALGGLVMGVAHEINTPIGTSLTAVTALMERCEALQGLLETEKISKKALHDGLDDMLNIANILLNGIEKTAELVRHFKQISISQGGSCSDFNLNKHVKFCISLFHPADSPHPVDVNIADCITLHSYPDAFQQMWKDLLQNVTQHAFDTGVKGRITITAELVDEHIALEFSDNGKGMTPEQCKKAFDPFYTTKRGSGRCGLGLHVVYNIITQKLKGTVQLLSHANHGVTFKMRFLKKVE